MMVPQFSVYERWIIPQLEVLIELAEQQDEELGNDTTCVAILAEIALMGRSIDPV